MKNIPVSISLLQEKVKKSCSKIWLVLLFGVPLHSFS